MDDAQLAELENLLEDAERRYSAGDNEAQMRERIKKTEADAAAEKKQIDLLEKELDNLRGIRGIHKSNANPPIAFCLYAMAPFQIHCQHDATTWFLWSRKDNS